MKSIVFPLACLLGLVAPTVLAEAVSAGGTAANPKIATSGLTVGWPIDPVTDEIDVLVVYDLSAVAWLAATGRDPVAFAEGQIAKMNGILANSGLGGTFAMKLCGTFHANFDVTRDCGRDADRYLERALVNCVNNVQLPWWEVRDARDRFGADLVILLADSIPTDKTVAEMEGVVGISYGLEPRANEPHVLTHDVLATQRESAYGACNVRVVEEENTFTHEAGHLMGAGHSELLDAYYSTPGPQMFDYSAAWMYRDPVDGVYYTTVMGYDSLDGGWDSPIYTELPYFSSVLLRNPTTGSVLGDARHDNVRTLRETYAAISQFRVNAERRRVTPTTAAWKTARRLTAAVLDDEDLVGLVQLKVGRVNERNNRVRISGTWIGLDGKKTSLKTAEKPVVEFDETAVRLTGKGLAAPIAVEISGNAVKGGMGDWVLDGSMRIGGALASQTPRVYVEDFALGIPGELAELAPRGGEPFTVDAAAWRFAKGAQVRYGKAKGATEATLQVSTANGRTNLSSMRLSYAYTSGMFRGSFRAYALVPSGRGSKLRSYSVRVTGLVVGGVGYGRATSTRPVADVWRVCVE